MSDLSDLQQLLDSLAPPQGFQLDDRTARALLEFLDDYLVQVPYGDSPDAGTRTWSRIFFMGKTPAELADIARAPALADGALWPQQAFLLAFLKLLDTPRALLNHLPAAHRQLYYRQLLGLAENGAQPSQVALSFQLAPRTAELLIPAGTVFAAGQDGAGTLVQFALDRTLLANQGSWTDLRWCVRARPGIAAQAHVAFDAGAKRLLPAQGLRLMDAAPAQQQLLRGRMVASAGLQVAGDFATDFAIQLAPGVPLEAVSSARISAGQRWLPLIDNTPANQSQNLRFQLPAGAGPSAPPKGLDGLSRDVPVLQVLSAEGEELSHVLEIHVNGQQVADFEDFALTPFGFAVQPQGVADDQLFLGFTGVKPGQTLSLYWQLQGPKPLVPRWEYLNQANEWASLDGSVADDTDGLFRSGLWSAVLPLDASDSAPAMPAGRHWIRALMAGDAAASPQVASDYPFLTGLVANAMTATLMNVNALDAASLRQPLPPDAVRQPMESLPGLVKTLQPWASFGGRPQESTADFLARAAQRLSHRQRALTWRDMAAILKADFSAVFDVATQGRQRQAVPPAQQEQRLIVIPLNRERDNADALRPLLNPARLAEMAAHLQRLASPWQEIVVANPTYRDVSIELDVRWRPGVNPEFGTRQLRQALDRHYMPWAGDGPAGVPLANCLDYYDVIAQAQALPEVESVVRLLLDGAQQSIQARDDEVLILAWPTAPAAARNV